MQGPGSGARWRSRRGAWQQEGPKMILFWQGGGRVLCEALDWSLYSAKGDRIFVVSEEALVGYLRANPDTEHNLRCYRLRQDMDAHREIGPDAADYGPGSGH